MNKMRTTIFRPKSPASIFRSLPGQAGRGFGPLLFFLCLVSLLFLSAPERALAHDCPSGPETGECCPECEETSCPATPPAPSASSCDSDCPDEENGVPKLKVSTDTATVFVYDTPMFFACSKGPDFNFGMRYATTDTRDRTNWHWPVGYRWCHNYQWIVLKRNPQTYQLKNRAEAGPFFLTDGTNFTETGVEIGFSGKYDMKWQGSNIVARKKMWSSMEAGRAGCATCGGSAHPTEIACPLAAWHDTEGFLFEPDPADTNMYRLKTVTGPDGFDLNLYYGTNNNISAITNAVGNEFRFSYSGSGYLTNILDVTGNRSVKFAYSNDLLAEVTDMVGQTFKYGYDALGQITSLKRPSLSGFDETTIAYQGNYFSNIQVTVTYPEGNQGYVNWNGSVMSNNLNGLGETVGTSRPFSWGYANSNVVTRVTDPLGRVTAHDFYDNTNVLLMGKAKWSLKPDGTTSEYTLDSKGNMTEKSDFDSTSNLIAKTVYTYVYYVGTDCLSNMAVEVLDVNSNVLSRKSSAFSRGQNGATNIYTLDSVKKWLTTNTYSEMKYVWNTNTWLLSEVQELDSGTNNYRSAKKFTYNAERDVVAVADALTNTISAVYDSVNRIIAITNAPSGGTARTTQYAFDNLDRITNMIHPDGVSESWDWAVCGCGEATHTDRGGNKTETTYDKNKRVKTKITTSINNTVLSYARFDYNSANQVTKTYDILSNNVENVYNSAGDLTDMIDELGRITSFSFDSKGRQFLTTFPDNSISSNTYDSASRLIKTVRYSSLALSEVEGLTSVQYIPDSLGRIVKTIDALGNATSNTLDLAGRTIKTTFADNSFSETEFDLLGNMVKQIGPVPAGATAQQKADATTSNSWDILDRLVSTTDSEGRITSYEYSKDWPKKGAKVRNNNNQIVQENFYAPLTGYVLTNISYNVVMSFSHDLLGQVTNAIYPDASSVSSLYDGSRLLKTTSRTGNTTSFGYDLAGRQISITNSTGSVITNGFDAAENLRASALIGGSITNLTLYAFDSMNRLTVTTRPDGSKSTNTWDALGRLVSKTGAGSVPVSYGYDALSRMTNLVDGMTNRTAFTYDSLSRLTKKTYADGTFYSYSYNPRGWLTQRTDAKGQNTGYAYNNVGQLTNINYATDTDVQYFLDTLGRTTGRVDTAGTWSWSYDSESSRIVSETLHSLGDGGWTSVVSYSYASNTFDLASVSCGSYTTLYSWAAGRLTNVSAISASSAVNSFSYTYKPNSDLLETTTYLNGTVTVHRAWDSLDRLTNISAVSASFAVNSFSYDLDSVGRRVKRTDMDNAETQWKYDSYDQLTNAIRSGSPNGAADAAYNFGYKYDQVGNRLHEDRGQLDLDGTFNNLNQLQHLDWSGKLDIVGAVGNTNGASVLVQGYTNAPPFYGTNWLGGAVVQAGSNSIPIVARIVSGGVTNYTETNRIVRMPPANPESFTWDLNGNMTSDGRRLYTWDNENRCTAIETTTAATNIGIPKRRSEYVVDANSRRVLTKDFSDWNGTAYTVTNIMRFVWDGFLVLAEIGIPATGSVTTNYNAYGLDLSQSLQDAGGIGGLLCAARNGTNFLYTTDGNGNVTDVLTTNGVVVAQYEYSPFGRIVAQSGWFAAENPWRFSSQRYEPFWKHYRYVYRIYLPDLHIWLNRDPIEESGGQNLYGFLVNSPTVHVDALGLQKGGKKKCPVIGQWRYKGMILYPDGSYCCEYESNSGKFCGEICVDKNGNEKPPKWRECKQLPPPPPPPKKPEPSYSNCVLKESEVDFTYDPKKGWVCKCPFDCDPEDTTVGDVEVCQGDKPTCIKECKNHNPNGTPVKKKK